MPPGFITRFSSAEHPGGVGQALEHLGEQHVVDPWHLAAEQTTNEVPGGVDDVLLTQVLEHLPDPARVLAELNRVMKPGGTLWLTAPLFYAEHERPYDYFRYTRYGLHRLLKQAGFRVREIEWLEGYFGTLAYQARMVSRQLPHTRADYGGGPRGVALAGTAKLAPAHERVRRRPASGARSQVPRRGARDAEELPRDRAQAAPQGAAAAAEPPSAEPR